MGLATRRRRLPVQHVTRRGRTMRTVRRDLALGEYVAGTAPAAGENWLIAIYLTTAAPGSAAIAEVGVENRPSLAAALLSAEISRHIITVQTAN